MTLEELCDVLYPTMTLDVVEDGTRHGWLEVASYTGKWPSGYVQPIDGGLFDREPRLRKLRVRSVHRSQSDSVADLVVFVTRN